MIQDNENTIFSIGASALQSTGPSRERLKSVSSAFGMSNFKLMPIDNPLLGTWKIFISAMSDSAHFIGFN